MNLNLNLNLNDLSLKYALDKNIQISHNYIPGYEELFEPIRNNVKKVLEIGIGSTEHGQMVSILPLGYKTGNSLKCWHEYFPHATIYGVDIYEHKELDTDRIFTFQADQGNEHDLGNLVQFINGELDVIIDDGSHQANHQVFTFMYLSPYLRHNGIYVIEDVQPGFIEQFNNLTIFPPEYKSFILDHFTVKCFDTRHITGKPDDFMISFTKK